MRLRVHGDLDFPRGSKLGGLEVDPPKHTKLTAAATPHVRRTGCRGVCHIATGAGCRMPKRLAQLNFVEAYLDITLSKRMGGVTPPPVHGTTRSREKHVIITTTAEHGPNGCNGRARCLSRGLKKFPVSRRTRELWAVLEFSLVRDRWITRIR